MKYTPDIIIIFALCIMFIIIFYTISIYEHKTNNIIVENYTGNSMVFPAANLIDAKKIQTRLDNLNKQMITLFSSAYALYNQMLEKGVAKECARMVLPLCTPTKIYMTGSCRSWIHYINLRSAHGTQLEHMKIAKECACIFAGQFPSVAEALEWQHESVE